MDPRYDIKEVEARIYAAWEKSGLFNPDVCVEKGVTRKDAEPFSVVLPPPNVTGTLHLGHAYEDTFQDIIVRFERMRGKRTLWVPGTDHAAIATQAKVEKEILKTEKKNRFDLGREEFLRRVNAFAKESHDTIVRQVKRMGASLDWSREAYTLDEERNLAVRTAFKEMYELGLIYRGNRVVNWDPKGQTVISDDEVTHEERTAKMYTFRYSKDFPIAISTTRPETKVGDTAVAVHPSDPRYKKFVGREFDVTFCGVPLHIKVIADESVEKDFGTGALGVTPAHSMADWEMAQKHKLPLVQVIDEYARMTIEGPLKGKKTLEARELIIAQLKEQGLIEKEEEVTQNVSVSERTGGVIEPLPKLQWFINVNLKFKNQKLKLKGMKSGASVTLKELMKKAVTGGGVKIFPERFEKSYLHWIENLRDWCISRQIWFGHRIPVWYCVGKQGFRTMGWAHHIVPQVLERGKARTYRLREHDIKMGEKMFFEDSQTKKVFGYGTFTDAQKTTVGEIRLPDERHGGGYKTTEELIAAFKRHYPAKQVTPDTSAWIYDFDFKRDPDFTGCGSVVVSEKSPSICPECGSSTITQDPDTFDTWFSSGMWTFSTLGWPKKTVDLATYHPTAFMGPGYEILYLWVARMILMSGCLLGDIPFKTVALHGIVRDAKGQKFSKSLGNGVDPLVLAEQYGADAIRMALIVGTALGNDVKFDEQKVKGYRNFSTKIWNIARFILLNKPAQMNADDNADKRGSNISESPRRNQRKSAVSAEHKTYLKELRALKTEITAHIEHIEFHLAAEKLYHYVWHTFADKIIEAEKERLKNGADAEKQESYALLEHLLLESLKMLHPFMPFVTEEIWGIFNPFDPASLDKTRDRQGKPGMLMVAKW